MCILAFGACTTTFSFLTYKYTREKFRLDLFDKRLAVYRSIVEFLYAAQKLGVTNKYSDPEIVQKFHESAYGSLRGFGKHSSHFLFGSDIHEILDNLNTIYAFLSSHSDISDKEINDKWLNYSKYISNTLKKLPNVFQKYMSFGSYT